MMKNKIQNIFSKLPKWSIPIEGRRYYFLLALLLFASFFISSFFFFPVDSLRARIERDLTRSMDSEVTIGRLAIVFPLHLKFTNIETVLPARQPYAVKIDSLLVKPIWKAFLLGKRGFTFSGQLNQGTAEGEVSGDGRITLHMQEVRFSFPLGEKGLIQLGGVAGEVRLTGNYPFPGDTDATLSFNVESLQLSGLKAIAMEQDILQLGQFQFQGNGQGTLMRVERLTLSGGAIEADAKGSVVLRQPIGSSMLRLTTSLKADPQLGDLGHLLSVEPASNGAYQIRLLGTLSQPLLR
jgi:type II secretion system protein N